MPDTEITADELLGQIKDYSLTLVMDAVKGHQEALRMIVGTLKNNNDSIAILTEQAIKQRDEIAALTARIEALEAK